MNRREFLNVLGGVSAASMIGATAFASSSVDKVAPDVTSMYVRGLVMIDLGNPELIRLGFPKAPGHRATLSIVPQSGTRRTIAIKGNGAVEAPLIASNDPKIFIPEVVRMKEFYGDAVKSHVDKCPSVINIPKTAIRSVSATEVSPSRYTFVRADNGEEVNTFRPRQIAATIKIDLSSAGTLKLDDGKVSIPLETAKEMTLAYAPEKIEPGFDAYADHFGHYFDYIEKPAALNFNVIPKKVSGGSSSTPNVGNRFLDGPVFCYVTAVP
jgi:hypothetical protein